MSAVLSAMSACAAPNTTGSPSASATGSVVATAGPAATACNPLDLRDPSGTRVALSGTWREPGGGPAYYLYQDGDCLWYVGGFATSDGEQAWGPLGLYTITYAGRIANDFTIDGRWAVVRQAGTSFAGSTWRDKTWTITFVEAGDRYDVTLTSPPDDAGTFSATTLVKLSDEVIDPP